MARKLRLEFEGARYHVISRGNYRKALFEGRAAEAFEQALFEACGKCGWKLHAYVIMSNHYHLALETPEANLVDGMKWLQGTFANRFNAYRKERGHVFQSRYKSLVVEEGRPMLGLVNYVHLNPVRAGMVALGELETYPWSSYPKFFKRTVKEPLVRGGFLSALDFPDSVAGMRHYAKHLEWCEESDWERRDEIAKRYSRGWAIAGKEFRKELQTAYEAISRDGDREVGGVDFLEFKEERWERILKDKLKAEGKTQRDVGKEAKSAEWKIRIAGEMRTRTTATNVWIAERLAMDQPSRVRNLIREKL